MRSMISIFDAIEAKASSLMMLEDAGLNDEKYINNNISALSNYSIIAGKLPEIVAALRDYPALIDQLNIQLANMEIDYREEVLYAAVRYKELFSFTRVPNSIMLVDLNMVKILADNNYCVTRKGYVNINEHRGMAISNALYVLSHPEEAKTAGPNFEVSAVKTAYIEENVDLDAILTIDD